MVATDRTRIEVGFAGGGAMSAHVPAATADELERALADGRAGSLRLDADEGRYTIVLERVAYVKRFARESRVGFGG